MWEAGGWKAAEAAERARKGRNISEADASCRHWGPHKENGCHS